MSEVHGILDQLRRAWGGDAFHGPAVRDILAGVAADVAFSRPLPAVHSIAEIALHIGTWEDVVRRRLEGEVIDDVADEVDWPAEGEAAARRWASIRQRAEDAHARLEGTVAELRDERLSQRVAARDYDVRYMLHGVVQHTLYHAGQIALLKRAAAAGVR